jgi:hypothetical protein
MRLKTSARRVYPKPSSNHLQTVNKGLHAFAEPTDDMDDSQLSRSATSYTARLDRTLQLLQDKVKEQEAALEKATISS